MSDLLVPGSFWRDKTPAGNWTVHGLPLMRRVVEVVSADGPAHADGRVQGVSFWQQQQDGAWVDLEGPGARRRTSVLRKAFLTKFEHVRGPISPP